MKFAEMGPRQTSLEQVNREIVREKAEALGRAGERLERLLAALGALRIELQRMDRSTSSDAAAQAERRYAALRAQALEARRHLMIQREAVGFRRHSLVTELFPVPPAHPRRGSGTKGGEA